MGGRLAGGTAGRRSPSFPDLPLDLMMRHSARGVAFSRRFVLGLAACAAVLACGCERTESPRFRLNFEGRDRKDFSRDVQQQWVDVLDGLFGQPDRPYVRAETKLDAAKIALASGPVTSDGWVVTKKDNTVYAGPLIREDANGIVIKDYELGETLVRTADLKSKHEQRGLYRQHCVHCHGTTGDGAGPTAAFLNPYPRDFRKGVFKFISNTRDYTPARADLKKTLHDGLPGSSMPSFALLPEKEVEALLEYVMYLSLRGQVEEYLVPALENDEFDAALLFEEGLDGAVGRWKGADRFALKAPPRPNLPPEEALAKGREVYVKAKCIECHGVHGLGDGQITPAYDVWNAPKVTDKEKARHPEWFDLPAQAIRPRNLRQGVYRGGRRPIDLFTRIYVGIGPSGMSGFGKKPGVASPLTDEEIWCLVDYLRSLPYERPADAPPEPPVTAGLR